ncbi:hypothetical protein M0802_000147 [Mischocyttarus mexicanus]|nr:hypothetical protein M0802_000147 [Mischocyttarus mexicanus]
MLVVWIATKKTTQCEENNPAGDFKGRRDRKRVGKGVVGLAGTVWVDGMGGWKTDGLILSFDRTNDRNTRARRGCKEKGDRVEEGEVETKAVGGGSGVRVCGGGWFCRGRKKKKARVKGQFAVELFFVVGSISRPRFLQSRIVEKFRSIVRDNGRVKLPDRVGNATNQPGKQAPLTSFIPMHAIEKDQCNEKLRITQWVQSECVITLLKDRSTLHSDGYHHHHHRHHHHHHHHHHHRHHRHHRSRCSGPSHRDN